MSAYELADGRSTMSRKKRETPPTVKPQWTCMVYMSVGSKSPKECIDTLIEIQNSAPITGISVLAQLDLGHAVRRYDFSKPRGINDNQSIAQESNKERGYYSNDTPVRGTLEEQFHDFLKWGIESYSNSYYLVLLPGLVTQTDTLFLRKDDPSLYLSIQNLKSAFNKIRSAFGNRISILGLDNCIIDAAVCYELRDSVEFLIGSEGVENEIGQPYSIVLKTLSTHSNKTPEELAYSIAETYISLYSNYTFAGISAHQSVCHLQEGKILNLGESVRSLVQSLKSKLLNSEVRNAILLARFQAQSYINDQYVDISDFCDLLANSCSDQEVQSVCHDVKAIIEKCILVSLYSGNGFQYSNGLSIYFPGNLSEDLAGYQDFDFYHKTGWGELLKLTTQLRRRPPREAIRPIHSEKEMMKYVNLETITSIYPEKILMEYLIGESGQIGSPWVEEQSPQFYFALEGDGALGNFVQYGTNVTLIFNYGVPTEAVAAILNATKLDRARESKAILGITIGPVGFTFREENDSSYRQMRFYEGSTVSDQVRFALRAMDEPMPRNFLEKVPVAGDAPSLLKPGFHIIFDVRGYILYQFFLEVHLVSTLLDLKHQTRLMSPIELNLDELGQFDEYALEAQKKMINALNEVLS